MKKYDFTGKTRDFDGIVLHRIRAVRDFGDVKAEYLGGWIEKEENLSHEGNAWVADNAVVRDNAVIEGNAIVGGDAVVRGNAYVGENAVVGGDVIVGDNAYVGVDAIVKEDSVVEGNAAVGGNAVIETTRDYITAGPMGSRDDTVTAYRTAEGIRITCGCFYGSVPEFEAKVKKRYGDNEYAKEYLAFAELLKARFEEEYGK